MERERFQSCSRKGSKRFLMNSMLTFLSSKTKIQEGQADFHPEGYYEILQLSEKGYSGTAILQKKEPQVSRTESMESIMTKVDVITYDDFYSIRAKRSERAEAH